jgi:hypothetical protein
MLDQRSNQRNHRAARCFSEEWPVQASGAFQGALWSAKIAISWQYNTYQGIHTDREDCMTCHGPAAGSFQSKDRLGIALGLST